jgi:hypothetical protein
VQRAYLAAWRTSADTFDLAAPPVRPQRLIWEGSCLPSAQTMRVIRTHQSIRFTAFAILAVGLAACSAPTLPNASPSPSRESPPARSVADLGVCGSQPLQPFEPKGVTEVPRGLSKQKTEDEVSKALVADSENCLRSASYLFAQAPEAVDVVVKAVLAQCRDANVSHLEHCNSLEWEEAISEFPFKGEKIMMRLYCGASKEPIDTAEARWAAEAYANVVRARAGRCWQLPRAE